MVSQDRSLIGPPLLDDDASSTIEQDIMRRVREWMAGGRVPLGTSRRCTARDRQRSLGGYRDMPTPEFVDPGANVRSHFPARRPRHRNAGALLLASNEYRCGCSRRQVAG